MTIRIRERGEPEEDLRRDDHPRVNWAALDEFVAANTMAPRPPAGTQPAADPG